jgi:hypothetical protein
MSLHTLTISRLVLHPITRAETFVVGESEVTVVVMPFVLMGVVRPPIDIPTEVRHSKVRSKVDRPNLAMELKLGCHMGKKD